MFDEKQLEQYRAIKAPQSLKLRVMAQENKPNKVISFPRKLIAVAACLAVIFISAFAFSGNGVDVSLSPASSASLSRNADICVVLDVDVRDKAIITASGGKLRASDDSTLSERITVSGETQLEWFVDYEKSYTLTVESGRKTEYYSLGFNEHSNMWEFEKIN